MARGRMLDRNIATSRKINACSRSAQWFYFRLMPFVDDEGRLPGDLFSLKNLCFPAEKLSEDESRSIINKLHDVGLVLFAENEVIEVVGFLEHQKIGHRPAKSLYPEYQAVTGKGQERFTRFAEVKPALPSIKLDYKDIKKNVLDTTYRDIQGLILTKDEYAKLCEKYSEYEVADVISAMENFKGLTKKYISAYKTALNWLKRRSESTTPDFDWSKIK